MFGGHFLAKPSKIPPYKYSKRLKTLNKVNLTVIQSLTTFGLLMSKSKRINTNAHLPPLV